MMPYHETLNGRETRKRLRESFGEPEIRFPNLWPFLTLGLIFLFLVVVLIQTGCATSTPASPESGRALYVQGWEAREKTLAVSAAMLAEVSSPEAPTAPSEWTDRERAEWYRTEVVPQLIDLLFLAATSLDQWQVEYERFLEVEPDDAIATDDR
ncbi:MAG: hypothetical protein MRY72_12295 [Aquisalinus sp.]|nr:hypothetical protein [Aquisalinus sp.]